MADPQQAARLAATSLAEEQACSVLLPAGSGKTELIIAAAAHAGRSGGRQLILTHTHAGVHAIRDRASTLAASKSVVVSTIDSVALQLASSFRPSVVVASSEPDWPEVEDAALDILANRHVRKSLRDAYAGLFVDEYQDCSERQHELVLALRAAGLPTRVFGDPLQSVFGFAGQPTVTWTSVRTALRDHPVPTHPWRWHESAPELGDWLDGLRQDLKSGTSRELRDPPSQVRIEQVRRDDYAALASAVRKVVDTYPDDSIAIIRQCQPRQYQSQAQQLRGFACVDAVGLPDVVTLAQTVDEAIDNVGKTLAVVQFLRKSLVFRKQPIPLATLAEKLSAGQPPPSTTKNTSPTRRRAYEATTDCLDGFDGASLGSLLAALRDPDTRILRPDNWYGLIETADHWVPGETLAEAVQATVDRRRHRGRRVPRRVVSTPLLLKGLEFDHVILTHVDEFRDPEFLYVAATRASRSLTICTDRSSLGVSK